MVLERVVLFHIAIRQSQAIRSTQPVTLLTSGSSHKPKDKGFLFSSETWTLFEHLLGNQQLLTLWIAKLITIKMVFLKNSITKGTPLTDPHKIYKQPEGTPTSQQLTQVYKNTYEHIKCGATPSKYSICVKQKALELLLHYM